MRWVGMALFALLFGGCASIAMRQEMVAGTPPPYLGARTDIQIIAGSGDWEFYWPALMPWGLMDLPFSVVMDTVLLPFELPSWYSETRRVTGRETPNRLRAVAVSNETVYLEYETVITKTDYDRRATVCGSNAYWTVVSLPRMTTNRDWVTVSENEPSICPHDLERHTLLVTIGGNGVPFGEGKLSLPDGRLLSISEAYVPAYVPHAQFRVTLASSNQTWTTGCIIKERNWSESKTAQRGAH